MMRKKLGLFGIEIGDEQLISDLLNWMERTTQITQTPSVASAKKRNPPENPMKAQNSLNGMNTGKGDASKTINPLMIRSI